MLNFSKANGKFHLRGFHVHNVTAKFTSFVRLATPVGLNFIAFCRAFIELATCIKAH
ncbi:hypothetical protein CPS_2186 [Colwellia psychrerythraea 34H]|uniref:Uncharacterized protein n=1 Tax=Colwellia psychrerythraea (strain 34H / ATCC BAA-681) TaxID=167879 RepID=Q482V6_COLP3|nr:hypothetical protein CPS_2186 [Colwellia psychrerythraea 34H]